ncbi:carboxypeptidase M-like isoform X3 [Ascaphus truei]|uniref:carboxypeptidase M-like isoform X3 n=1 Tax=Ascaphus truei TaxID=8439 RepID=UPI003F59273D
MPAAAWLALLLHLLFPSLSKNMQSSSLPFKYHDEKELEAVLWDVKEKYSSITHLYSIGRSVQGVPLWVLAIGYFPALHMIGIPEVKYIGNIHGNEPVGRELLLHLIDYLLINYGHDEDITALIKSTRIHFLPAMNPDGFKVSTPGDCGGEHGRNNFHNVDLNRNFPYFFGPNPSPPEPETLAVMQWFQKETFVLSGTLHGGAVVAVYPFSFNQAGLPGDAKTPDDEVFRYLAKTYARAHKTMHKGNLCNESFPGGVINSAAWYPVKGCLQDYNYIQGQCLEVTLEVSCCKYPVDDQLQTLWQQNQQALIELIKQVHKGIKGRVLDTAGNPIPRAALRMVAGPEEYLYTAASNGEFYKIVLPGKYTLWKLRDFCP